MNAISLEARKRLLAEDISKIEDASVIEKIENILNNFTPSVKRFKVKDLEERVANSEKAIEEGRVYITDEVIKHLGLD